MVHLKSRGSGYVDSYPNQKYAETHKIHCMTVLNFTFSVQSGQVKC